MTRGKLLPAAQQDAVVSALYNAADEAGWSDLTPQERSAFYRQWIEDEEIGGVLTRFMTHEAARSWIKDGPMKEYANASRGTGRYARLGREGGTGATDIARAALGPDATVVAGTQRNKPHRCVALDSGGRENLVVWGAADNLRNLLWTALRADVINRQPAHVVILETHSRVNATAERAIQHALAERCRLPLHHLEEVVGTVRGRTPRLNRSRSKHVGKLTDDA